MKNKRTSSERAREREIDKVKKNLNTHTQTHLSI